MHSELSLGKCLAGGLARKVSLEIQPRMKGQSFHFAAELRAWLARGLAEHTSLQIWGPWKGDGFIRPKIFEKTD